MSAMLKVYSKIVQAQQAIKQSPLKKAGWNEYSKFHYWTPEQVSLLVSESCIPRMLFNHFDLKRGQLGLEGHLTVTDLESGEACIYIMAMEIPSIKATNASQQLGGAMTYAKRYMLQNVYDIADNSIDPDANQGAGKKTQSPPPPSQGQEIPNKGQRKPTQKRPPAKKPGQLTIADLKSMSEVKRMTFICDLLTGGQASRIPGAIVFCEEHKYLSADNLKLVNIYMHLQSLTHDGQKADYIFNLINNTKDSYLSAKVFTFACKYNLLSEGSKKTIRLYMQSNSKQSK